MFEQAIEMDVESTGNTEALVQLGDPQLAGVGGGIGTVTVA